MSKNQCKKTKDTLKHVRIQRGLDRKAFFEAGGELSQWRGVHTVVPNKKKVKNKQRCRGRIRG
mgnify:CR=1 FL=1|tara:strand:+ start:1214 stop:1402 length:189 start_codon:yes stop_codon:yes gene_type:complete